jgi:hypothetical protein
VCGCASGAGKRRGERFGGAMTRPNPRQVAACGCWLLALALPVAGAQGLREPAGAANAASAASAPNTANTSNAPNVERTNRFNDPFTQVTHAIDGCPAPDGPSITEAEMRAQSHWRAERGTSCFQSGRCRLPNAYLYDKEIIPRVDKAIHADGRFADTSVWAEGQRRWVWLKGCVRTTGQSQALEQLVRGIDDVEAVVNELVVTPAR